MHIYKGIVKFSFAFLRENMYFWQCTKFQSKAMEIGIILSIASVKKDFYVFRKSCDQTIMLQQLADQINGQV